MKTRYILLCSLFYLASLSSYAACSIDITPLNFGTYDVFSTNNSNSNGLLTVTCSPTSTSYVIAFNGGLYGNINQRKLKLSGGSDTILYNLFTDANHTIIWGDNSSSGVTVSSVGATPITIYGSIPAQQDVSIGYYNDNITVTVMF